MVVAGSVVMHATSAEAGTIYSVPADQAAETLSNTNPLITGGFTAGQTNYVSIDLRRAADDTTADLVSFLDADSQLETQKTVPLARTLSYRIYVSTTEFEALPYLLPVAIVVTTGDNNVDTITDARKLMFRLGSGGSGADDRHSFPWLDRSDPSLVSTFTGVDKSIVDLKSWVDAIMTRLWEQGGGENWYSATADRNVTLVWTGATFSNGENFEWDGTHLHWQGLKFLFDNSTGYYNEVENVTGDTVGLTDLDDGDCIYVDLDRSQNLDAGVDGLNAAKASMITLGAGSVPGARQIVAWRSGASIYTRNWRYAVGTTFTPATTSSLGMVALNQTPASAGTPKVVSVMTNNVCLIDAVSSAVAAGYDAFTATGGVSTTAQGGAGFKGIGGTGDGYGGHGLHGVGGDANPVVGMGGIGLYGIGGSGLTDGAGVTGYGGGTNGAGIDAFGAGTGAGLQAQGGATDNSYTALFTSPATNGHGIKATATGTGIAAEFNGSGATETGLKVTTGYARLAKIQGLTDATNVAICYDGTGVAKIGNTTGGVDIYGDTYINGNTIARGDVTIPDTDPGDASIPAARLYKYNTSVSKSIHVPAAQFNVATGATVYGYLDASGSNARNPYIQSAAGGADRWTTSVHIPAGATITDVELLAYFTGAAAIQVYVTSNAYGVGGNYTENAIDNNAGNPNEFSIGVSATWAWRTVTTGTWTSTQIPAGITSATEGMVTVTVEMPAAAGIYLRAVRILYSLPAETAPL
jgi:hypothetical protein